MPKWHFLFAYLLTFFYIVDMTIKQLRKQKGYSQLEISKLFNMPIRTYKRYENEVKYENTYKYLSLYKSLIELDEKKKNVVHHPFQIAVSGIGYVGLTLAVLLAQHNEVTVVDVIKDKVDLVNQRKSPFKDSMINQYLGNKNLKLVASLDKKSYQDKDIVVIATPTDFDQDKQTFNTIHVEEVLETLDELQSKALIVIKSTIPIGFVDEMKKKFPHLHIIFSPEFLREGQAIYDNLYPSRIIVGTNHLGKKELAFASLLEEIALKQVKTIFMSSKEAEAVKLFANAYLAMRVAYFNELDSYAKSKEIRTEKIIEGMSLDPRIGDYYNNPSFGYGGYCLPKDSKALSSSFTSIPNNNLIQAIVESNLTRKLFVVEDIIKTARKISHKAKKDIVIGIYSLSMKEGSDNFRNSASVDIMNLLIAQGIKVIVYDKNYPSSLSSFSHFVEQSDLIIANRNSSKLKDVQNKLYTRDIYQIN